MIRPIIIRSARRSILLQSTLALLLLASACAGGPTGSDENPVPPLTLVAGQPFAGTLPPGGAKEFVVTTVPGNIMRVMLWAHSGDASDSLVVDVRTDSAGPVVWSLSSVGSQAALGDRVLHLPMSVEERRLFLRVRAALPDDDGAFSLLFAGHDNGVEHGPSTVEPGDTITYEEFDSLWDLDRFTFVGDSGAEYVLALEPLATNPYYVALRVHDGVNNALVETDDPWTAGPLERHAVRVAVPASGTYVVTLGQLVSNGAILPRPVGDGRYRFWVAKVNPAPESRPGAFSVGDTLIDALDHVGDVDTYTFDAPAGELLRLDVSFARAQSRPMLITVTGIGETGFDPGFAASTPYSVPASRNDGLGARFVTTTGGQHRIVVRGGTRGMPDSITTPYRLELRRVNAGPESRAGTLTGVDTVTTERVERAGDIDEFDVDLASGEIVDIRITALNDRQGALWTRGFAPDGTSLWSYFFEDATPSSAYLAIEGWSPGTFRLQMLGYGSSIGSYRVETTRINRAPEMLTPTLPINVWTAYEPLSPQADADDFTFPAIDGRAYNIFIESASNTGDDTCVRLVVPSWLNFACTGWRSTGRFRVGPGGIARITVQNGNHHATGPYRLRVSLLDSLPETLAQSGHTFGDTLVGESLDLAGDSDEFLFNGLAGQVVRTVVTSSDGRTDITFNYLVFRESDGLQVGASPSFTLPSTGLYRVVVNSFNDTDPVAGAGAYRLATQILP